jgi:hypothetical protein
VDRSETTDGILNEMSSKNQSERGEKKMPTGLQMEELVRMD